MIPNCFLTRRNVKISFFDLGRALLGRPNGSSITMFHHKSLKNQVTERTILRHGSTTARTALQAENAYPRCHLTSEARSIGSRDAELWSCRDVTSSFGEHT